MTTVVDASAVLAALVDNGAAGRWAEDVLAGGDLAGPHLLLVEVASALRKAARTGAISADTAGPAHRDLLGLDIELFPYPPFADRAWDLRENITSYDSWYVALAEALDAPLATLDDRLVRSPGPTCAFVTPA